MDEDTDQHSHPLFRMSPGMEMLGAEKRKNQTLLKKKREIQKKCDTIFPGNNTDNISKCGDIPEPPTVTSHGKAADGRRTNEETWPKDQSPGRKQ